MKRRTFVQALAMTSASLRAVGGGRGNERPNVLWLTSEDDNVSWIGCYGNPNATTPNVDRLAKEGFQYMNAFASAPVCAPSRSTWITGINAVSMGTHPMRSRYAIPHDKIRYYPDFLKDAGYYVANYPKTDYNIGGRNDKACWDNPGPPDWEALKRNQPFFQVINAGQSHESQAKHGLENTRHDPAKVKLRAYHPDLPIIRKNYARYLDCVENMDTFVGKQLKKLEEMGLADDTIVIHCSDHGGVLPRSKRYIFQSGLHSPLIVRIPGKYRHLWPAEKPGAKIDRLVSFVDMPKTWLAIANAEIPDYMQGRVFLGPRSEPEPEYHYAFRGRMDERIENARVVCTKRFLYLRDYMPYVPWMQKLLYLWEMPAAKAWDDYVKAGKANETQSRFFRPKGWTEELYDMKTDPDNVNNLIDDPEYAEVARKMRAGLRSKQIETVDAGLMPESEVCKLAHENRTTIYEMARNPRLYSTERLLDAADIALARDRANAKELKRMLADAHVGIRYWGMVGAFLLGAKKAGLAGLNDESHEIRALAAWLCVKTGEREKGLDCLRKLLEQSTYATLSVLNVLDWMGDAASPLAPVVRDMKHEQHEIYGRYAGGMLEQEKRMRRIVLEKYGIDASFLTGSARKKRKK